VGGAHQDVWIGGLVQQACHLHTACLQVRCGRTESVQTMCRRLSDAPSSSTAADGAAVSSKSPAVARERTIVT